jgi:nitroreductase
METLENIKTRRSVRRFTEDKVSHETIEAIIDASRMAPSWKNTQTVRYTVIETPELIQKLAADCVLGFEFNQKTLEKSSTVVVLSTVTGRCGYERDGSYSTSKGSGWEMFDAGIAAQTFCLAAHDLGIGSCIMGIFDEAKVAELLQLPEGQTVSAIIPFGVPKFAPDPTPRKEVSDLLSYR